MSSLSAMDRPISSRPTMSDTGPHQPAATEPESTGAPSANPAGAAWQLAHLLDGYLTTQLLYVAAKLGIGDVLTDRSLIGGWPARRGADREHAIRARVRRGVLRAPRTAPRS